mmetsp:Transcript_5161/g.15743  ORF Transcript_5161/g.15743 Transcript_5161/m.15743 type:complete len:179 (+) Transcript_5161:1351-1887(+)
MDVFPTALELAGLPLPSGRPIDGRSFRDVIMNSEGKSRHKVLFFYGGAYGSRRPSAARYGPFKAHWATGPGLSGCKRSPGAPAGCPRVEYTGGPLLFHVEHDPSEARPLSANVSTHKDPLLADVLQTLQKAYDVEMATLDHYSSPPAPDGPGEGPGMYGICCDRLRECNCDDSEASLH